MYRTIEDLVLYASRNKIADSVIFVKKMFTPDFDKSMLQSLDGSKITSTIKTKNKSGDFFTQFYEYIKLKKDRVSKATYNVFSSLQHQLHAFKAFRGEKIEFKDMG